MIADQMNERRMILISAIKSSANDRVNGKRKGKTIMVISGEFDDFYSGRKTGV